MLSKYLKKGFRISWIFLVSIAVLLFTLLILLQDPRIQTRVSQHVVENYLSHLDGSISIEKIHFKPFNTIIVKNLVVKDKHPLTPYPEVLETIPDYRESIDTLLNAEYLIVRFSILGLLDKDKTHIHIEKAEVKNGFFGLTIEDGRSSLDRVIHRFKDRFISYLPKNDKLSINIDHVEVNNMAFSLDNFKRRTKRKIREGSIIWSDFDCVNVYARGKNLHIQNGIVSGELQSCRFQEARSGLKIDNVSTKFNIREGYVNIMDIHIKDKYTDLHLPYFRMIYDGAAAFKDYIGKVRMSALLKDSEIDTRTLDYFADISGSAGIKLRLNGEFDGTVKDFKLNNIKIDTPEGKFSAIVNGRVSGLPAIQRTRFEVDIKNLKSDDQSLEQILHVFGRKKMELPTFNIRHFNTHLDGDVNNIALKLALHSDLGKLALDGKISELIDQRESPRIEAQLSTDDLRLDRILNNKSLGGLSLESAISARLDRNDALAGEIEIDSIHVEKVQLLGYDYGPIDVRGTIQNKDYEGSVVIDDENLKFYFNGLATLLPRDKEDIRYLFDAGLEYVDFQALGLSPNGLARIKLALDSELKINANRQIEGSLDINEILLENEEGIHNAGDLNTLFYAEKDQHKIRINSEFLEGEFEGSRSILHLLGKNLNQIIQRETEEWDKSEYKLSLAAKDSRDLLAFFAPDVSIQPQSALNIHIDSTGFMTGLLSADKIRFSENDIRNIRFEIDNRHGRIGGKLNCNEVELGQFKVNDIHLNLWADLSTPLYSVAGIGASEFKVGESLWNITPCQIDLKGKEGIHIHNFSLTHQNEGIFADGILASADWNDKMTLSMNNFDLGLISGFLNNTLPDFSGLLSGEAMLSRKNGKYGIEADVVCENTHFNNYDMGTLLISSEWDEDLKRYNFLIDNSYNSEPTFELGASYSPFTDDFFISGDFNQFEIGVASYFVKDIFHQLNGELSGLVTANGNIRNIRDMKLSSYSLKVARAKLGLEYTKVAYDIHSDLEINNQGAHFKNAVIRDRYGNTGQAHGAILWNHFRQMGIDLHIQVNKIEALNIKEQEEGYVYYGHLFGSGAIDITGPFNALLLDIKASTSGVKSDFNLTLKNLSKDRKNSKLLQFKGLGYQEEEKTHSKRKSRRKKDTDLNIKLDLDVTQDITANIDIDKFNGSRITAQGDGNILINIRPTRDLFKINGNYNIADGNVRFVAFGLTAKDFKVNSGSSVSFAGDAWDTQLNIDATYKTKASLSTIIADSTAINTRRTVDCGIRVTDKLKDPKIAFSINVPDLEPSYKTRVESALSTEDKVQRQFLALLLSSTFLPDEQSGIANNTAVLFSNVSELMTTQLNNIFMKLNIPLDLGFNYQMTSTGANLFDVAVSTQLFNNRVLVNGVIGNKQQNGGSNNEVVGDIDIEVKINPSGSLRASAFSHSSDQYTNYLDNLQRTGIGISWQQEFNSFVSYIKQIFSNKKDRGVMEQQEKEINENAGTKRVIIQ